MIITVEMIMKHNPCREWSKEKVEGYIGSGKTLSEILNLKGINIDDKIWCVTRFLSDKINRKFAIWCARQCENDIKEVADYIDVIEKFYNNEAAKEELVAVYRAAYWAAYEANWAAYRASRREQLKKLKELVREIDDE